MAIYKDLEGLFEYLLSVRKLKTYLSFDVEIPSHWKIPKRFASEDKVVEINPKNENKRGFSFVSNFLPRWFDITRRCSEITPLTFAFGCP